ncbi:hypothetical protein TSOC_013939, partial [Tetrabaena socialis]
SDTLRANSGGSAVRPPSTTNFGSALVSSRMSTEPPRSAVPPHGAPPRNATSQQRAFLDPSSLASLDEPASRPGRAASGASALVQLLATTDDIGAVAQAQGSSLLARDNDWQLLTVGSMGGAGGGPLDAALAGSSGDAFAAAGRDPSRAATGVVQVVGLSELAGGSGDGGGGSSFGGGGAAGPPYGHAATAPEGSYSPLRTSTNTATNDKPAASPSGAASAAAPLLPLPPASSPRTPTAAAAVTSAFACAAPHGAAAGGGGAAAAAAPAPVGWYQLRARTCTTLDGGRVLLLMMSDVTPQKQLQERVTTLVEQEHRILEALFPRHVIAYLTAPTAAGDGAPSPLSTSARQLSRRRRRSSAVLANGHPATGDGDGGGGAGNGSGAGTADGYGGGGAGTSDGYGGGSPAAARSPPGLQSAAGSDSVRRGHAQLRQMAAAQQRQMVKVSRLATEHKMITILFTDVVGFTAMSRQVAPIIVMRFLNELYQKLDALLDVFRVYKPRLGGDPTLEGAEGRLTLGFLQIMRLIDYTDVTLLSASHYSAEVEAAFAAEDLVSPPPLMPSALAWPPLWMYEREVALQWGGSSTYMGAGLLYIKDYFPHCATSPSRRTTLMFTEPVDDALGPISGSDPYLIPTDHGRSPLASAEECVVSGLPPAHYGNRTYVDLKGAMYRLDMTSPITLRDLVLYNLAPGGTYPLPAVSADGSIAALPEAPQLVGADAAWANSSLPLWFFRCPRSDEDVRRVLEEAGARESLALGAGADACADGDGDRAATAAAGTAATDIEPAATGASTRASATSEAAFAGVGAAK